MDIFQSKILNILITNFSQSNQVNYGSHDPELKNKTMGIAGDDIKCFSDVI